MTADRMIVNRKCPGGGFPRGCCALRCVGGYSTISRQIVAILFCRHILIKLSKNILKTVKYHERHFPKRMAKGRSCRIRNDWRVTIPPELRERYGLRVGDEMLFMEQEGSLVLIPLRRHDNPASFLQGAVRLDEADPQATIKRHVLGDLVRED